MGSDGEAGNIDYYSLWAPPLVYRRTLWLFCVFVGKKNNILVFIYSFFLTKLEYLQLVLIHMHTFEPLP